MFFTLLCIFVEAKVNIDVLPVAVIELFHVNLGSCSLFSVRLLGWRFILLLDWHFNFLDRKIRLQDCLQHSSARSQ